MRIMHDPDQGRIQPELYQDSEANVIPFSQKLSQGLPDQNGQAVMLARGIASALKETAWTVHGHVTDAPRP